MTHKVMVAAVLERYEAGELDTYEQKKPTYRWPYDDVEDCVDQCKSQTVKTGRARLAWRAGQK
jgi:hypothetical protein